ncbi:MAG TPA: IS1595 family transposase, partial [Pyrinomonadaceae bacterium]
MENIQSKPKMQKFTIKDFEKQFPNDDVCLEWLKNHLFPNGVFCVKCQKITNHYKVASRKSYSCQSCGNHFHPTAKTIYHKSSTPLRLWFYATYLMASTRCGISAKQLERELGVTYKTAWRMFKQIRSMLSEDDTQLCGKVEVDETYVGGRKKGGKRGRGSENKTIVAGAVERQGKVVARVVPNVKSATLVPFIYEKVLPSSLIFTDELPSYNSLKYQGYEHKRVHHAENVYVLGDAHTNSIEGFWSLVKGGIRGVYHSVSAKYLQSYFNEYAFRYNRRKAIEPMFMSFLRQV